MYIDVYIAFPLWIFAIFGFIYFLIRVFMSLDLYRKRKQGACTLVISAKNQEISWKGLFEVLFLKQGWILQKKSYCKLSCWIWGL